MASKTPFTDDLLATVLETIRKEFAKPKLVEHPEMKWEPWQSVWAGKDDDSADD